MQAVAGASVQSQSRTCQDYPLRITPPPCPVVALLPMLQPTMDDINNYTQESYQFRDAATGELIAETDNLGAVFGGCRMGGNLYARKTKPCSIHALLGTRHRHS